MTVAESLRDKLRYNMMMNHDSIEASDKIFGFDTPAQRELKATLEERLFRNETPHRMERKASKKTWHGVKPTSCRMPRITS